MWTRLYLESPDENKNSMERQLTEIVEKYLEGNYLLSSSDKAQMISEILDLLGEALRNINETSIDFTRLLSSRSFWRDRTLKAINECKMDFDHRPTLTIGKHYKPILKYLSKEEFLIKDDEDDGRGGNHWFGWEDLETYFELVSVDKKNGT